MTGQEAQAMREAVREALEPFDDPAATAIVLRQISALPTGGNQGEYLAAIIAVVEGIWRAKLATATADVKALQEQVVGLEAMNARWRDRVGRA